MCQPRVGQKRDIGDCNMIADQPIMTIKHRVHEVERALAAFDPPGLTRFLRLAQIEHVKAADRDIGLVAALLPEQPLIHLGLLEAVLWQQAAAGRSGEPSARN